jgi:sialic acid synthase SpsE
LEAGVEHYKIASHGVTNYPLLEAVAKSGYPVVLSSGMSTLEELDRAVEILDTPPGNLRGILHCVSSYPTPPDEINLRLIRTLSERYGKQTGYSGHELGILPTLAAVAYGASIVERHFTLDTGQEGFDHHMSLDPRELKDLVASIRLIELMRGDGIKKVIESEMVARNKYRLSLVASEDLPAGTRLNVTQTEFRNPGTGISPEDSDSYIGRVLRDPVEAGEMILPEAFLEA